MKLPPVSLAIRAAPITPNNKSTAVTIATWLLTVTFVIMFLSREAIKFVVLRKFQFDDLLILLATISAIGLSIVTLILASNGLGKFEAFFSLHRANAIQRSYYASDFFYISSICFAKLSLIAFFYGIGIKQTQRRIVKGFGVFILLWTFASLIAVAFQCGLPRPWEMLTLHCYNTGVFWIVYCIIDMTTDVSIIMLSVNLVAYLQVKLSRKVTVVACFAPRVLVIGASLARLIYLFPINSHDDPEFNLWVPVVCTQVQVCLSISTACIPYMKPFFEGVEAGVWRAGDLRRKGMTVDALYAYGSKSARYQKGHAKGKEPYSMDSVGTTPRFGRTPDVSPQIPSPELPSPLTAPRLTPPPNSRASSSRSPSERGLRLHIPPTHVRTTTDIASPQTASSHALSPQCWSPRPLLSPFPPSPTRPLPPPKGPQSLIPSSHYGSPDLNTLSPPSSSTHPLLPPVRIPTFPRPPSSQYSQTPGLPSSQFNKNPPPPIPRLQIPRSNSRNRISVHRMAPKTPSYSLIPPQPRYQQPPNTPPKQTSRSPQNRSRNQGPLPPTPQNRSRKPTPLLPTPPNSTPQSQSRNPSPQPQMYSSQPWSSRPPTPQKLYAPQSPVSPPSPSRVRNLRVLSPQNSSRNGQGVMDPKSPGSPPTPLTFWREESSGESVGTSAGAGLKGTRWPIIKDVRSSPRIVVNQF
ncbi:hypothetical protein K469DRAFT_652714 [Zopfia rhizophila CBS 207.26]|uniref:Rhodopsin domain-containing protein n=1 Tax=Zopfia rhizophila CBS 207.26 TaxID=1314779 RepID=A0A6A6ESB4_9PEZI|nr:hypothetical protein K469DRAFT_652714 [Zopfia rhizophila CBS 207.26]